MNVVRFTGMMNNELAAELRPDGSWFIDEMPALSRILTSLYATSEYGPADGDPVKAACGDVAKFLHGVVILEDSPPVGGGGSGGVGRPEEIPTVY